MSKETILGVITYVSWLFQTLQQTFQTIDQLELLVGRVKEDLTKMEKAVAQGESQLGASQGFTTVIKPLFFVSTSE